MDICPRCGVAMVTEVIDGQSVALCRNANCVQYQLDAPKRAAVAAQYEKNREGENSNGR